MAAKKKGKGAKKATPKKQKKSVATTKRTAGSKKKPVVAKKAAPKKQQGQKKLVRTPPMHAKPSHQELDDDEHEEVFEIFKAYDRDGSGSIDRGEFARLLEALGQSPTEMELTIALDVVDANHSGKISWDEFKAWWSNR
ncbi:MAG: EF-hand domain-containing protein [Myxococcaceae bacterium]|nr:EF-hand domain-containing protein [Myxococcaceae bacterium]